MSTLTRWLIAAAVVVAVGHYAATQTISAQQEAEDIASDASQAKRQAIAERRSELWRAKVEKHFQELDK
jgi:hypothetical protein